MSLAYLFDSNIQFQDRSGNNNVNGFLRVYIDNTDDRAVTYKDFNGTLNQADIRLDNNGRAVVIVDDSKTYRLEVYGTTGVLLWTLYPISPKATGINETLEALVAAVKSHTIAIEGLALGKKNKQQAKVISGIPTQTVKSITQNADGEITVEFEDIAFPHKVLVDDEDSVPKHLEDAIMADELGKLMVYVGEKENSTPENPDKVLVIDDHLLREDIDANSQRIENLEETIAELDMDSVPHAYLHSTLAQSAGDSVTTSTTVNVFAQDALEGDCFEFEQTTTIDDTPFGYVWIEPGTYLINASVTFQWVGNPRGTFVAKVGAVMGENFDFSQEQEIKRNTTKVVTIPNRMKLAVNVTYDKETPAMGFWIQSMQVVKLAGGLSQTNIIHDDTLVGRGSVADPLEVDEEKIAQSTLAGNLAPAFDAEHGGPNNDGNYPAGYSVMYHGKFYTFKVNHSGAWNGTDVTAYNVYDFIEKITMDVDDIKSVIDTPSDMTYRWEDYTWQNGYIRFSDGDVITPASYSYSNSIAVRQGDEITLTYRKSSATNKVSVISGCDENQSSFTPLVKGINGTEGDAETITYTVPYGVDYVSLCCYTSFDGFSVRFVRSAPNISEVVAGQTDVLEGTAGVSQYSVNDVIWSVGWIKWDTKEIAMSDNHRHSIPIPVSEGDVVTSTYSQNGNSHLICIICPCNADGTTITDKGGARGVDGTGIVTARYKVPSGVSFVTISRFTDFTDWVGRIVNYDNNYIVPQDYKNQVNFDFLKNKVAYFLGDSIAHGSEVQGWSFPRWIAKWGIFKTVCNLAKGGSGVSYVRNTQVPAISSVAETYGNPDYIFIMVGVNDFYGGRAVGQWFNETDGTRTYNTNDTICGNMNQIISTLQTTYPTAKIILMTPLRIESVRAGTNDMIANNGIWLSQYRQAYIDAEMARNIWCFDTWSLAQLNPHNEAQRVYYWNDITNGYDGTHPSREGQKIIANSLIAWLKSKYCEMNDENALVPGEFYQKTYS